MSSGRLPGEVFQARPTWRGLQGKPKTSLRDYTSWLVYSPLAAGGGGWGEGRSGPLCLGGSGPKFNGWVEIPVFEKSYSLHPVFIFNVK